MTFSLRQFKAYGIRTSGATRQHTWQVAELGIVAANTDTALDISSDTAGSLGTFWTAAVADATYGTLATNALGVIRNIIGSVNSLQETVSEPLMTKVKLTAGGIVSLLSAASAGGSATEAYTVTGLLATDTILAVTPQTVTANTFSQVLSFLSAAISTGTSVTATVTGLLSTDTVIGVTQAVANANTVVPVAFGSPSTNALPLTYAATSGANGKVQVTVSRAVGGMPVIAYTTPPTANTLSVVYPADPGAGAKVEVLVNRTAATDVPTTGQYGISVTGHLPSITFASGDAPTSQLLKLVWCLQDGVEAFVSDLGAAL